MRRIEIRPIKNREQLEACFDLWATVFPESRTFFQRRIDGDSAYDISTTWAAYVEGNMAAAIQIFPYETEIDGVRLKIGGIGSVATHPDYRRMGLAQALLRAQSRWMQKNGYDASLLFTGIHSFYEQVGWRKVDEVMHRLSDVSLVSEQGLARRAKEPPGVLFRPFEEEDDIQQASAMYESWRTRHPGAWLRTDRYWRDSVQWLQDEAIAVERDGRLVAYAFFRIRDDMLEIREINYHEADVDVVVPLWQKLLTGHPDVSSVHVQLPSDHALYRDLSDRNIAPTPDAFSMWKVIDTRRLIGKLQPLFSRLARTHCEDTKRVHFQIEANDVCLLAGPEGVELLDSMSDLIRYDESAVLNSGQLMQWLLYGVPDDHIVCPLVQTLFPKRPGVLWWTDHF